MAKVITFSREFPKYHPKKGQPTLFVEKIWNSLLNQNIDTIPDYIYEVGRKLGYQYADDALYKTDNVKPKHHTIRMGKRWKVGDKFSPRIWSGKPYRSKQIAIADDIEIKKVWDIVIEKHVHQGIGMLTFSINNGFYCHDGHITDEFTKLATNDGLSELDLAYWFTLKHAERGIGQIICWNENINY